YPVARRDIGIAQVIRLEKDAWRSVDDPVGRAQACPGVIEIREKSVQLRAACLGGRRTVNRPVPGIIAKINHAPDTHYAPLVKRADGALERVLVKGQNRWLPDIVEIRERLDPVRAHHVKAAWKIERADDRVRA